MDAVGDEVGEQPILGELGEDGVVEFVLACSTPLPR